MYTYIPISPPSCVSLPPSPSHPSRWSQHRADLPVLCGCFPLAICFTFGRVYVSMSLSSYENRLRPLLASEPTAWLHTPGLSLVSRSCPCVPRGDGGRRLASGAGVPLLSPEPAVLQPDRPAPRGGSDPWVWGGALGLQGLRGDVCAPHLKTTGLAQPLGLRFESRCCPCVLYI